MRVTRDNLDRLLDAGALQMLMNNGRWWTIRRNGKTQLWKRDPDRLRLPIKFGMYGYSVIDDTDFDASGALRAYFRVDPMRDVAITAAELLAA